jgi:hypothetical protein
MKRSDLKEYFRRQYTLLVEQEEEEEDPFADDAGEEESDEGGEEESDEAAADEEGEDEDGDEEEVDVDEEDKKRFQRSIDDHLQGLLIDIESDSIKSAAVKNESNSLKRIFLFEASEVDIDLDKFASEVARLILNFDAFVNIEELVMTKVRNFLTDKHGVDAADEVEKLLSGRHGIMTGDALRQKEEEVDEQVPIAVGAVPGGSGA